MSALHMSVGGASATPGIDDMDMRIPKPLNIIHNEDPTSIDLISFVEEWDLSSRLLEDSPGVGPETRKIVSLPIVTVFKTGNVFIMRSSLEGDKIWDEAHLSKHALVFNSIKCSRMEMEPVFGVEISEFIPPLNKREDQRILFMYVLRAAKEHMNVELVKTCLYYIKTLQPTRAEVGISSQPKIEWAGVVVPSMLWLKGLDEARVGSMQERFESMHGDSARGGFLVQLLANAVELASQTPKYKDVALQQLLELQLEMTHIFPASRTHLNLGCALRKQDRDLEAATQYIEALKTYRREYHLDSLKRNLIILLRSVKSKGLQSAVEVTRLKTQLMNTLNMTEESLIESTPQPWFRLNKRSASQYTVPGSPSMISRHSVFGGKEAEELDLAAAETTKEGTIDPSCKDMKLVLCL